MSLDLSSNYLGLLELQFGKMFQNLPSLRVLELNLKGNFLGDNIENLQNLSESVLYLKNLKNLNLNLSTNNLGENVQTIAKFLQNLPNLTILSLNLSKNALGMTQEEIN